MKTTECDKIEGKGQSVPFFSRFRCVVIDELSNRSCGVLTELGECVDVSLSLLEDTARREYIINKRKGYKEQWTLNAVSGAVLPAASRIIKSVLTSEIIKQPALLNSAHQG